MIFSGKSGITNWDCGVKLNKTMDDKRLKKIISGFNQAKILVIGDFMLDEFIWGEVTRISPEAPVPVVKVNSESSLPGGALNAANNIHALGGGVLSCGVIGDDIYGQRLREVLKKSGMSLDGIIVDTSRPTTLKTRIFARHQHQVVRVDREDGEPVADNVIEEILTFVREKISLIDVILIEDYGKGVIGPRLLSEIFAIAKKHKKMISVDPKEEHFSYYKGATVITPNHHEAQAATRIKMKGTGDNDSLTKIGRTLLNDLNCQAVLITRGEEGMCLFEASGNVTHIPTVAQQVFDVSGAGDTVIGAFSLALASGATMKEAAHISNYAGGIVVGKVGVAIATQKELLEKIG